MKYWHNHMLNEDLWILHVWFVLVFFPNRKEMVQNNNADLKGKDDAEGSSFTMIPTS